MAEGSQLLPTLTWLPGMPEADTGVQTEASREFALWVIDGAERLCRVPGSDCGGHCLGPVWPLWGATYPTGAYPAGAAILHQKNNMTEQKGYRWGNSGGILGEKIR